MLPKQLTRPREIHTEEIYINLSQFQTFISGEVMKYVRSW